MPVVGSKLEWKIVALVDWRVDELGRERMVVDVETGQEMDCNRERKWRMVH